jgi:hypothetical protein
LLDRVAAPAAGLLTRAILANGTEDGCYTFLSVVAVARGNAPAWAGSPYVFVYYRT